MRRSDIFEEFVKIAKAQGLLSKATPEEVQRKLENNPRLDALDASAIEALYGVKPDTPKDMEYKRNIIEDAHPDMAVVSPSYDKLNGLVENLNERQNIIMHIVKKMPDGHITQKKYAEKQLLLSLVRLGNDLDNQNKEDLRILADVCLEQASTITKKGIGTLAIAGLVAIPVILGGLYLQQHMNFRNETFTLNQNKLIAEIDDMLQSNANYGVGVEYGSEFISLLRDLKKKVLEVGSGYSAVIDIIKSIEKPKTGQELMQLAESPQSASIVDAYNNFKKIADNYRPYFAQILQNFQKEGYKLRNIKEKGALTKLVDWTGVLHGGKGLIADDFDDVVRALNPYLESFEDTLKVLAESETLREDAKKKIEEAKASSTDYRTPTAPAVPTTNTRSRSEIDDESGRELAESLSGSGLESSIGI